MKYEPEKFEASGIHEVRELGMGKDLSRDICNMLNVGLATWGEHFLRWGFDPYIMDGEALVTWWTMFDWACWIAYAPLMAIFFAMISYGRTIRQFMIVNWILPSASYGSPYGAVLRSTGSRSEKRI